MLSWKERRWDITPNSRLVSIPWKRVTGKHWRAPVKVTVAQVTVVPPRSHTRVKVRSGNETEFDENGFFGTFGLISPVCQRINFMIAHGVAHSPTWVQVANPSQMELVLKEGQHLGDFHPRKEMVVQKSNSIRRAKNCGTSREKKKRRSTNTLREERQKITL